MTFEFMTSNLMFEPVEGVGRPLVETSLITFVGIDGGSSGSAAASSDFVNWDVFPTGTLKVRGHGLLCVHRNLDFLRSVAANAGGLDRLVVVYEQSRKNPMFGFKNNFVNGRNEEFWRVLLTVNNIKFASVDPKTWQSKCFQGITCADTKDRAREYIRRQCPGSEWLDEYNKAPREAIVDAMCIAFWAREQYHKTQHDDLAWSGGQA